MQKDYFPFFIDLNNKWVIVCGGGKIATRRIKTLLSFGAKIKVITKTASEELLELANSGTIALRMKEFTPSDIEPCFLVLAATDNEDVNNIIYYICREKGIIVNCSHDMTKCDFYFPAIIKEQDCVIGITANGRNHSGVKKLADKIRGILKGEEV